MGAIISKSIEQRVFRIVAIGKTCLFLGLVASLLACVEDNGEATGGEEDIIETQEPIRGGDGAGISTFAVGLKLYAEEVGGGTHTYQPNCTGTALSPHWILTAAHCLEFIKDGIQYSVKRGKVWRQQASNSTTRERVYDGNVDTRVPTGWNPVTLLPLSDDVGLIRLYGDGMNPAPLSWARIYSGTLDKIEDYIVDKDRIRVTGWGRGNYDPGDNPSCSLSSLYPRYGQLSPAQINNDYITGTQDKAETICVGDSGGPWWINPSESAYKLQFGVSSRGGPNASLSECEERCFSINTDVQAVYLKYWLWWIEAQSSNAGLPLNCLYHTSNGWSYNRCYE